MKRNQVHASTRLAASVRRYHTWPMLTQQTVADHSYHCLRIWAEIFGPPPAHVTMHFIWHDLGEIVTGDLPFPMKARNGQLKCIMDELEQEATAAMGAPALELQAFERTRAKCCDLIDMHEVGLQEAMLGNAYAQPIIDDTFTAIEDLPLAPHEGIAVFKYLANARALWTEAKGERCTSLKPGT